MVNVRCPFRKCPFNKNGYCTADEIVLTLKYNRDEASVVCRTFKVKHPVKRRKVRSKLV